MSFEFPPELEELAAQLYGAGLGGETIPAPAPVHSSMQVHLSPPPPAPCEWIVLEFTDCTGTKFVHYQPEKFLEILERLGEITRQAISGIVLAKELPH